MPESIRVFILPPSLKILKQRLENRGTETTESLDTRLRMAEQEMSKANTFDYIVINSNLDSAINSVREILKIS